MSTMGEFLRRMRDRQRPVPGLGASRRRRRTPGLRREEVAERAGVSVDWYVRLEQDRAARPSGEVLEAVADALELTAAERRYLFRVARGEEPPRAPAPPLEVGPARAPHASLAAVLAALPHQPAMILGPRADALATNPRGEALFGGFGGTGRFGRNVAWFTLCDPRARALLPDDYDRVARDVVGTLRAAYASRPGDAAFAELIAELTARSPLFDELWRAQLVHEKAHTRKRFAHPLVGSLDLDVHVVGAPDADGELLVFYEARDAATRAGMLALSSPAPTAAASTARRGSRTRRS